MKSTVRNAIVIAVLLGTLLPGAGFGFYVVYTEYVRGLKTSVREELRRNATIIATGVEENLWSLDRDGAGAMVDAVMLDPALISVDVLDATLGSVVHRARPERDTGHSHQLELPVMHRGEAIGTVRVSISEEPLRATLREQTARIIGLLCLQIIVSVLLILAVLQRRVGNPLQRLGEEVRRLASGKLDHPITPWRNDEIGELEARLETTRQSLRRLFSDLGDKNAQLEHDLQERHRVEAIARDREQRLQSLVEQSPLPVIEFDPHWQVQAWNASAEQVFGWPRAAILGQAGARLFDLTDTATVNALEQSLRAAGEAGVERNLRVRARRQDGSPLICRWHASAIRDGHGAPQRMVVILEDITARQARDDEFRRLAAVVRLSTTPIVLATPDARIDWFNEAFARRFEAHAIPTNGRPLLEVIDDGSTLMQGQLERIATALRAERSLSDLDLSRRSLDGRSSHLLLELQAIHNDRGELAGWVALFSDVTERRQISDALGRIARLGGEAEPAEFLTGLLEGLTHGCGAQAAYVARPHKEGSELLACVSARDWPLRTGVHAGRGALTRLAGEQGVLLSAAEANAAIAQEPACADCRNAGALIVEPLLNTQQRVIGHLALFFDAAPASPTAARSLAALGAARASSEFQRLGVMEALRQSELKFFSIFQHAPIPLCVVRRHDSLCLDANPGFITHFGYPRELVVGASLVSSPLFEDLQARITAQNLIDSPSPAASASLRLRRLDGSLRDCQIHLREVTMNEEACLLVAFVDVSALLEAQRQIVELNQSLERRVDARTQDLANSKRELELTLEQLRQTLDELVHAEKLAALGSLVAGVAHELNTPIGNSLMAASTLHDINQEFLGEVRAGLRRSVLDTYVSETTSAADILLRNLKRAAELITSFKQVAVDQTSSQRREFALAELVSEILVTMQPVLRKSLHQVKHDIPPELRLDSYPGPLGQVISNLVNNALVHAFEGRQGGHITLEARAEGDERICLECRDDGVGISAANLKRVFDPFFTTRLGRNGSGLGLNIVHNIVSGVLGGDIEVSSAPGQGACFTLHLPRCAPRPPEAGVG